MKTDNIKTKKHNSVCYFSVLMLSVLIYSVENIFKYH